MKVVIGYDGSDSAVMAIRGLHRAGLPSDPEALVVTVADVFPQVPQLSDAETAGWRSGWHDAPIVRKARALADAARAEAQTLAAGGANLVKAEFPGWKVSHAAFAGTPYAALLEPSDGAAAPRGIVASRDS